MKHIIKQIGVSVLTVLALVSCSEDILDRAPLDNLSVDTFFATNADLEVFVNGLYSATMPRYNYQAGIGGLSNAFEDEGSDFLINQFSPSGSIFTQGNPGVADISSPLWNGTYDQIRRANFFIVNSGKIGARDNAADQYIGEGYFFRALHYFSLLNNFGGVPIIETPLNITDEELYTPRSSRSELASFIIKDLDSAITNLSWKGEGPAGAGRINKETALTFKARVALFEGSWEYYHGQKNTPFAESGQDGTSFLQMVEPAVNELIAHQGSAIFTNGGIFNEPYNQLFAQVNGASVPGAFWYRVYNTSVLTANSHNFYWIIAGTGASFTDRLVNMYLDADGIPQSLSARPLTTLNEKGANLEPRFRQTIWTPDRGAVNQLPGRTTQIDEALSYPPITNAVEFPTSTGYRQWKGAIFDASRFRAGEVDDILVRYAEALLSLAEAKAILGTITQADIDKTVNLIRSRVGTPDMNLAAVNGWAISYDESEGFDSSAPNIVNEIRRERSVEFANEGFRRGDLRRWAVFENAINGYIPKGAQLQEFIDYFNDPAQLAADGYTGNVDFTLVPGTNVMADPNGLINPLFRTAEFVEGGQGFFIAPGRDYLSSIPKAEIDLYNENGVNLTQNPGWN